MANTRSVTVIGASGFVGGSVAARCGENGRDVTGTACETDSPYASHLYDFFTDAPPAVADDSVVVFCATVERTNHDLATFKQAAHRFVRAVSNARVVYLSTDAVFDGKDGWYTESDPVNPCSAYGRRTVLFESLLRTYCSDHAIIRPSYVYGRSVSGWDDRLSALFERLGTGEPIAFYDDYYKSPIEVTDLAAIAEIVAESSFVGTLHAGGPRLSVYAFYRRATQALGAVSADIQPESRPANSTLPVDTSLDAGRLQRRFDYEPAGPVERLTGESPP